MGILTFDAVRQIGLALPGVVDGTAYGAPALKLGGKLLACIPVNKSAEANSIAVRIDLEHRAELLKTLLASCHELEDRRLGGSTPRQRREVDPLRKNQKSKVIRP
jgi:hypothetical protein